MADSGSLLIVTGPPGAGKSTAAALVVARFEPSVLVAGDTFFEFLARGVIEPWLPASNAQNETVIEAAGAAAGRYARGGFAVIYDGVVGPWFLPTFLAATGLDRLDYAVILPTVERCVERVASRVGHGFTDEPAARKMHAEFASAAATVDPRHVLVVDAEPPELVADRLVAAQAAGELAYPG